MTVRRQTEANRSIEEIWKDDLLDRRSDASLLIEFLLGRLDERKAEGRRSSYVLNLDSEWGQGKTFFLKRLEQQLMSEGYLVAYVNAWEDDHADDPLIAVMSSIDEALKSNFKIRSRVLNAWSAIKRSGLEIAITAGK